MKTIEVVGYRAVGKATDVVNGGAVSYSDIEESAGWANRQSGDLLVAIYDSAGPSTRDTSWTHYEVGGICAAWKFLGGTVEPITSYYTSFGNQAYTFVVALRGVDPSSPVVPTPVLVNGDRTSVSFDPPSIPATNGVVVGLVHSDESGDSHTHNGLTEAAELALVLGNGANHRLSVGVRRQSPGDVPVLSVTRPSVSNDGNQLRVAGFTVNAGNSVPNAPTVTVPSDVDLTQPLVVPVGFSDPDAGDSASASYIRFRRTDVTPTPAWAVISRNSPTTTVTIPADTLVTAPYELQGASRDAAGAPTSDANLVWSTSVFFDASVPPEGPVFTDPATGETITTSTRTFTVSVPDVDELQWRIVADLAGAADETTILDPGGTVVGTRQFTATGLANGVPIHPQARAKFGGLFGAWGTSYNPVDYTEPPAPAVALTLYEDPDLGPVGFTISPTFPAPVGDEPTVNSYAVERSELQRDGTWTAGRILAAATAVAPGGAFDDLTVRAGVTYRYRVRADGANGTSNYSAYAVDLPVPDPEPTVEGDFANADFALADFA